MLHIWLGDVGKVPTGSSSHPEKIPSILSLGHMTNALRMITPRNTSPARVSSRALGGTSSALRLVLRAQPWWHDRSLLCGILNMTAFLICMCRPVGSPSGIAWCAKPSWLAMHVIVRALQLNPAYTNGSRKGRPRTLRLSPSGCQ